MKNETSNSVEAVLLRGDPAEVSILLDRLREKRELDGLLQSVVAICGGGRGGEDNKMGHQFAITRQLLDAIGDHFCELSALTAHEQARWLLELLKSSGAADNNHAKRNVVLLLRALVEHIPLLSATRLRYLIKNELLEQCVQFWRGGECHLAAQLTLCVLQTLLMELAYMRGVSTERSQQQLGREAQAIWARLLDPIGEAFNDCAFLQLCTLLLLNGILAKEGVEEEEGEGDEEEATAIADCRKQMAKRIGRQKMLQKCTQREEEEEGEADGERLECSYNSALFDLISRNVAIICLLCPSKMHFPIINFLVTFAQRHNRLTQLLRSLATNPSIRYGEMRASIEAALVQALLPTEEGGKWCKRGGGGIRWRKVAGESAKKTGKQRRRRKGTIENVVEHPQDWAGLVGIFEDGEISEGEQEERLALALAHLSNAKLEEILLGAPLGEHCHAGKGAGSCLRLLHSLASQRKSAAIPLRAELADLVMAEPEPRINALLLGAKLLKMHAQHLDTLPQLPDFCSLCLALFRPLHELAATNEEDELGRRRFLMAELAFMRSLLTNMPKLLSSLAPLIIQLLPDFFVQSSNYRRAEMRADGQDDEQFPDRLEHSLSCVCREILKRRKYFQRLLPFVLASSLTTGERQLRFPHYQLMSAMDENDLALLSANLSAIDKRKFALLRSQFYECNKIIG